nr:MAG TPA: hypothetical protein [Caudoviricetes sp.]
MLLALWIMFDWLWLDSQSLKPNKKIQIRLIFSRKSPEIKHGTY